MCMSNSGERRSKSKTVLPHYVGWWWAMELSLRQWKSKTIQNVLTRGKPSFEAKRRQIWRKIPNVFIPRIRNERCICSYNIYMIVVAMYYTELEMSALYCFGQIGRTLCRKTSRPNWARAFEHRELLLILVIVMLVLALTPLAVRTKKY
jgi:hypothetical protein